MARNSFLQIRRGRYYFRRRYPRWLVCRMGPGEIVKVLPPCSYQEAIDYVHELSYICNEVFRLAMKASEITREGFAVLAREQFNKFQQKYEDEQQNADRDSPGGWVDASRLALSEQDWATALPAAKKVLSDHGYDVDIDNLALREFCRMLVRGVAEASRIAASRMAGDYLPGPKDPLSRALTEQYRAHLNSHQLVFPRSMIGTEQISWLLMLGVNRLREKQRTHTIL